MIDGWRYYNHALLPTCAPHITPDASKMDTDEFWSHEEKVLLARWTTDYDCSDTHEWWYVVKDNVFDISNLKAKRRYEINKGKKNFTVKVIEPNRFVKEIIDIYIKAYEQYPIQYRPSVNVDRLEKEILSWKENTIIFGAFTIEDKKLVGVAMIIEDAEYANFAMLKTMPEYEKKGVNAAIVASILEKYNARIASGYYICDGERALFHETNFQEYLEKYFGFRKAYSKLHVKFVFPLSLSIIIASPFKNIIKKSSNSFMKKLYVLLQYYEISKL